MTGFFAQQRRRFERPRVLWQRHDAARFLKPAYPRTSPRIDPRWDPLGAAEQKFARLADRRAALALEEKYSPNQPRVPAGNPRGGQWTRRNEGGGGARSITFLEDGGGSDFGGGDDFSDFGGDAYAYAPDDTGAFGAGLELPEIVVSGGREENNTVSDSVTTNIYLPGSRLAQNESGYGVDLLEERELGGHTIERHVGKSEEFLLRDVRQQALSSILRGDLAEGLRSGSFSSIEAANKLVNSALSQNPAILEKVISGSSPREEIEARFESPTGYEAFVRNERSAAVIRQTYGVRVVVVPDSRSIKGYRVETAFPINTGR